MDNWNGMEQKKEKKTEMKTLKKTDISPETDEILEKVDNQFRKNRNAGHRNIVSNLMIVAGVLLIVVPLVITFVNMRRNADAMDAFLADTEGVVNDAQASVENVDAFYQNDVDFGSIGGETGVADPSLTAGVPQGGGSTSVAAVDLTSSAVDVATTDASASPAAPTRNPLMSKEEIQRRMIGVLYVDKIGVRMPVMDGVDEETLRVAAGRMPESGKLDKIGNVVLAGPRSYTFGKYFNRLDELEVGDTFIIKTGKKSLEYKIFKKFIVEPDDFSILNYNKTDKICTLFTCHPVVIANKRLVVQAVQTN